MSLRFPLLHSLLCTPNPHLPPPHFLCPHPLLPRSPPSCLLASPTSTAFCVPSTLTSHHHPFYLPPPPLPSLPPLVQYLHQLIVAKDGLKSSHVGLSLARARATLAENALTEARDAAAKTEALSKRAAEEATAAAGAEQRSYLLAARAEAEAALERVAELGREVEEARGELGEVRALAEERQGSVEELQERVKRAQEVRRVRGRGGAVGS